MEWAETAAVVGCCSKEALVIPLHISDELLRVCINFYNFLMFFLLLYTVALSFSYRVTLRSPKILLYLIMCVSILPYLLARILYPIRT